MWLRYAGLPAALLVLAALGCSKSDPSNTPSAAAVNADAPEVYVKGVIDSAAAGDASVIWNMLPAKQQGDVKTIVQEAGNKVDGDVWNKSFVVLGKVNQLLKTRKDYILGSEKLPMMSPQDKEYLGRNWGLVSDAVDALANSELKTIDGLKTLDPGKFLTTTGTTVMTNVVKFVDSAGPNYSGDLKAIKSAKVELVKREGDTATVRISAEGKPPTEETLHRVDGKWVFDGLLKDWDGGVNAAKAGLAGASMTPEQKQQALGLLAVVDGSLDRLLAAADQKAFDAELGNITTMAAMFMPQPTSGPPPGVGGPTLGPSSTPPTLPTTPPTTTSGSGPLLPGTPSLPTTPK